MRLWQLLIGLAAVLLCSSDARAQGLLEPVQDSDVQMRADRATLVQLDDRTKLLLLQGDVTIGIGTYGFRDESVVVRITRRPGVGEPVRDFAFVFEDPESIGQGGIAADAQGLLVTAASRGRIQLTAELTRADALPVTALTQNALERFATYDLRVSRPLLAVPQQAPLTPAQIRLRDERRAAIEAERPEIDIPNPQDALRNDDELVERPVLPVRGTIRYGSVDRIVYQRGEFEDAVILIGGVEVLYQDLDEGRDIFLTAERIVIFLDKDDDASGTETQIDAGRVTGVYLEDDATVRDGTTTVRAPRAFYDLKTSRAILLEAVIYSVDIRQRVPLYMRADVVRQTSADSFVAEDAIFTTSEFAKPHLSIGASRITLQQIRNSEGETESWVTAEDATLNVGETPVFYWPGTSVEAGSIPIRQVRVGFESDNGATVQTGWDLFALSGYGAPNDVDLTGQIDLRGEHGLALGTDLIYNRENASGRTRGYFLPDDSGTDNIAQRNDIGFSNEMRGFFHGQHRQELPTGWELWLEGNYVSDPTFLEEFFRDEAYAARPYETSAYFKRAEDDWALTGLVRGEVNNFQPQYTPLLTPGYAVNKLPETEYRLITSVFDDRATLYHESRVGRMRAVFGSDSPGDRGFTAAQSAAAFGIAPGTSFDDAAIAAGFPRSIVTRLDSRSEITAPMRAGAFDLTPFVVGRVTAYDDDFADYNGGNNDQARLWGGLGFNTSTQMSKVVSDINNSLFDIQGLRHIIEPSFGVAYYDGTMNSTDLPIYDPEVERLTEGGVARIGVVNTWQTNRGGPGRTRTVDWIQWRNDVVLVTEDSANPAAIGRYYDYRPEYTLGDDHFYSELMWAATEVTALTGELTHSFDEGSVVQWRLGIENRHTDALTTSINYREIDALNAKLLSYGAQLQLTTKYRVGLFQVLDFGEGTSRTLTLTLDRRMPRATLGVAIGYDDIDGAASLSIVLTPEGINRGLNGGNFFGQ